MKRINTNYTKLGFPLIPCEPKIKELTCMGKRMAYDENSMDLIELDPDEAIDLKGLAATSVPYCELMPSLAEKHLVFQATYACNLNCRYCFVRHHYCDHTNTLTEKEHYDALNMFQPKGPYRMGWFGGEPLMNWETIYKVTESVCAESKRRKLPNPQFHITSNGTLLTQEIANYCASRNFSWIISIDGPQAMHDANRPYKDGRGTYDEVMRGLVFLKRAYEGRPNPITLRGTFDKENPDVLQAVKHLNELMYQGFGAHVSVEPSTLGEGSTTKSRLEGLLIKEIRSLFTPQYEETARWFVKEIKEGRKPSLHHFQMPMQRLLDRDPAFTECGAGMGYVSVGPQGKICACHREHRTDIGNMATGIDPRKVSKWRDNRFYVRNMCNTCWRRLICGGGCRVNSLLENNKINDPSIVNCVFTDIQQRCAMWILSELTMEERKMYSKDGFGLMSPFLQPGRQPFVVPTQNNYAELGINPKDVMPPAQPIGESPACQKSCQYDCQANCMFSDQAAAQEALKRQQLQGNRCACSGEQKQGALSQLGVQQSQDGHCACSGEDQKECACFRGEKKEPHTPSNDD